jgi:hypothetical protein
MISQPNAKRRSRSWNITVTGTFEDAAHVNCTAPPCLQTADRIFDRDQTPINGLSNTTEIESRQVAKYGR